MNGSRLTRAEVIERLKEVTSVGEGDFEEELRAAIQRLGVALPPEFRSFFSQVCGNHPATPPNRGWP